jgi:hypothetical protein
LVVQGDSVVEEWVVAEEWVVEEWVAGVVTQVERPGAGRAAVGETMASRGHLGVGLTLVPGVAVEILGVISGLTAGEVLINI